MEDGEGKDDSKESKKLENIERIEDKDDNNTMISEVKVTSLISNYMSLQNITKLKFGGRCPKFSIIIIYIFWTFYSIDIYLIFFLIYSDGESIPYSS